MPADQLLFRSPGAAGELLQVERGLAAVGHGQADETRHRAFGTGMSGAARRLLGDQVARKLVRIEEDEERPSRRDRVAEAQRRGDSEASRERDRSAIGLVLGGIRKLDEQRAVADVPKADRRRQDRRLQKKNTGTPVASMKNPGQVPRGFSTRRSAIRTIPATA